MLTYTFWSEALQRAVRTFAQTILAGFGGSAMNVWSANWHQIIGLGLGASVLSILMSIDRSGHAPAPVSVATPALNPRSGMACGDQLR